MTISTNRKDKNGVEVYEGDIVRLWNGNKAEIKHNGFQFVIGKKERPVKEYEIKTMTVLIDYKGDAIG